jgi:hypothetical protein
MTREVREYIETTVAMPRVSVVSGFLFLVDPDVEVYTCEANQAVRGDSVCSICPYPSRIEYAVDAGHLAALLCGARGGSEACDFLGGGLAIRGSDVEGAGGVGVGLRGE